MKIGSPCGNRGNEVLDGAADIAPDACVIDGKSPFMELTPSELAIVGFVYIGEVGSAERLGEYGSKSSIEAEAVLWESSDALSWYSLKSSAKGVP